jgi:hypothetical protein
LGWGRAPGVEYIHHPHPILRQEARGETGESPDVQHVQPLRAMMPPDALGNLLDDAVT